MNKHLHALQHNSTLIKLKGCVLSALPKGMKTFLVALDASPRAPAVLDAAISLAKPLGAKLVRQAAGGRWVEGCEQPSGGLGATLRQDGTIVGECRIPPTARGGTWLYRLQVAARPALWPWLATPSPVVRLTLSR